MVCGRALIGDSRVYYFYHVVCQLSTLNRCLLCPRFIDLCAVILANNPVFLCFSFVEEYDPTIGECVLCTYLCTCLCSVLFCVKKM